MHDPEDEPGGGFFAAAHTLANGLCALCLIAALCLVALGIGSGLLGTDAHVPTVADLLSGIGVAVPTAGPVAWLIDAHPAVPLLGASAIWFGLGRLASRLYD